MKVRDVSCPCCTKLLFRQGLLDGENDIWGSVQGNPKIVNHEQGDFMSCPNCSKWVLLQRVYTKTGIGYILNDQQWCWDKLPQPE